MSKREIGMNVFDEREKAFEAKYRLDEETSFKVTSRRNKLLGQWAAAKLGLTGAEAEAYARGVIESDMAEPGDSDVIAKIAKDFADARIGIAADGIGAELERLKLTAHDQVMAEIAAAAAEGRD